MLWCWRCFVCLLCFGEGCFCCDDVFGERVRVDWHLLCGVFDGFCSAEWSACWLCEAVGCDLCVVRVVFDGDEVSSELLARDGGGAGADEGVADEVACLRVQVEEVPEELHGLLCRVWLPVPQTAVVQDWDAPYPADFSAIIACPDHDDFIVCDAFAIRFMPDMACHFKPTRWCLGDVGGVPEEDDEVSRLPARRVEGCKAVDEGVIEQAHPVGVRRVRQGDVDARVREVRQCY